MTDRPVLLSAAIAAVEELRCAPDKDIELEAEFHNGAIDAALTALRALPATELHSAGDDSDKSIMAKFGHPSLIKIRKQENGNAG